MVDDPGRDRAVTGSRSQSLSGDSGLSESVLEKDRVYEALAHRRRRYLCYALLEDKEWSLTDLATKTAAWENDVPESEVSDSRRDEVYVSLYHAHVPKLVDERIIRLDEATETITPGEHAGQVLRALEGVGTALGDGQETHERSGIGDDRSG